MSSQPEEQQNETPQFVENRRCIEKDKGVCFNPVLTNRKTIGINGFGRIGKLVYSLAIKRGLAVTHINNPNKSIDDIIYSLTYDNCYGKLLQVSRCNVDPTFINGIYRTCSCAKDFDNINESEKISPEDDNTAGCSCENESNNKDKECGCEAVHPNSDSKRKRSSCCKKYTETNIIFRTKITNFKKPEDINWQCDLLIEASGIFKTKEAVSKHNVKNVLITAPSKDIPMYVYGVNHQNILKDKPNFLSNASCTTNCLAPLVKLLDENFGVVKGTMSTIHAVTASQSVVDKTSAQRRNRTILNNIIPTTTGAATAVTKVFPHLEGRLDGMAFRVPTLDVSCVDLTVFLSKECTKEQLIEHIKKGNQNILDFTLDEVVSSDFIGDPRSSIIDVKASMFDGRWLKLVAWYDNEFGYANRVVDLTQFVVCECCQKKETQKK